MNEDIKFNGESFNFGPNAGYSKTVEDLLYDLSKYWNLRHPPSNRSEEIIEFHEAGLLRLNCDKASFHLKWTPTLEYAKLIELTSKWYYYYYYIKENVMEYTIKQIQQYEEAAVAKKIPWAR